MQLLAVGDVCGDAGCEAVLKILPKIKRDEKIDMVIINGENSAEGNGISPKSSELLFCAGADVITGGNHTLRRRELHPLLDENPFLLRPDNIETPYGSGYCLMDLGRYSAAIINLSGQIYLDHLKASNPFNAADVLVERAKSDGAKFIFVDFHAEATSEKQALGIYLDGRVSAFFGTHTHIQTADACVLRHGTGYITDLGMTGPGDSVLGVDPQIIINRLKNGDKSKFHLAESDCIFCGCIFSIDDATGLTVKTKPIFIKGIKV